VILDWVPSHFPEDAHGLGNFDGTNLYEHPDPKKGYHPDWKSLIFNYGRNEVRAFLISNALFWLEYYHVDGLRVDAVASMLYLDYSREEGEWDPNQFGGNEYLEAVSFIKELNQEVYKNFPDVQTIAEESTNYPMVSKPISVGGLGFGMKWMMGWMHDTLDYFSKNPVYRRHHHNEITFSLNYAFSENFMLPFSHDEVVYGKKSMLNKMPGDEWQKCANLRSLYGFMFTHPGSKLLFQGCEFGQLREWNFEGSLDWDLLEQNSHKGIQKWITALNALYRKSTALYKNQFSHESFEWVSLNDYQNSVLIFKRKYEKSEMIVVCNFTPSPHLNYSIGDQKGGALTELLNSDAKEFWGTGQYKNEITKFEEKEFQGKKFSTSIVIAPLACQVFELKQPKQGRKKIDLVVF
jgi:1,4-alpha-glucan branching enzyme